MTKAILPKLSVVGPNAWSDVQTNDEAIATVVNGELDNENLKSAAGITTAKLSGEITRAKLAPEARGIAGKWYEPKIIATEESRTNAAFGTLTTADEVKEVVLPTNGLIMVGYRAHLKASAANGLMAVFLNENEVKTFNNAASEPFIEATFRVWSFTPAGVATSQVEGAGDVTTGQFASIQGPTYIFANAGTYNVSVRFKSASGSVTATQRKLWVAVLGF